MGKTQRGIGHAHQMQERRREDVSLNERLLNAVLAISGCATIEEALEPLLHAALDVTKMDGGGVYWVDGDVAVLRHHRGLPEAFIREVMCMSLRPLPVQTLLHQREPIEVAEISPVMRELLDRHGIRHAFSFPLRARETIFGFLNVGSTRLGEPERADIQALQLLVYQMESLFDRLWSEKALRESEERFRAFMNNSPTIAWMKDEQGRHVYLSETFEKRFGLRLDDCRGKTDFELWPREIAEEFRKNDLEVLRTRRAIEVVEETPAPDGGRSYWWSFKFPFQDASGRKLVGGIGMDITERRRMEDMLRRMNERLEEEVQTRTQELNHTVDRLQKLALELTQAEERERRQLAEFLHDDLQQMLAAAKFQLSILADKVQGDKTTLATARNIRQMLKEAIEKTRSLSHELSPAILYHGDLEDIFRWVAGEMESKHGLAVQVEVRGRADSLSEPVKSFLCRIAQELLFNVVKHAKVRGARLRLQRVRNELWLVIVDKGQGFDVESLAQATGFGLMRVRERVELLGGRMKIRSAPGKGSIFFIAVPDGGA